MKELENKLDKLKKIEVVLLIILILIVLFTVVVSLIINEPEKNVNKEKSYTVSYDYDVGKDYSWIRKYIGDLKKGSDVKLMIDDVISQNNQYVNESGKFISIKIKEGSNGVSGFTPTDLNSKCDAANIYAKKENINNQENINAATEEMRKLRKLIVTGRNYKVTEESDADGRIHTVYITELSDYKNNSTPTDNSTNNINNSTTTNSNKN